MTARAAPRERPRRRTRRLATLFGLLFLIVAGFAIGTVAGVVWEDPGLVFAYVTGQTEDVAWRAFADTRRNSGGQYQNCYGIIAFSS